MRTVAIVAVVAAAVAAIGAAFLLFVRTLARRVVAVARLRRSIEASATAESVTLPRSVLTEAPGEYGLWFGDGFSEHVRVGRVVDIETDTVVREVLSSSTSLPNERFLAHWTGHSMSGPEDLGRLWREVVVPLEDGGTAPAWFFPAESDDAPWAVHVQGIRTSRLVTLRAVEAAQEAGFASLVITYRGAGDGAPARASTLGQTEWVDLRDAVSYARSEGAASVIVMAWSMGAGLALELARRDPAAVDGLVLISPATNWRGIIDHAVAKSCLPRFVASAVVAVLGSRLLSRLVGLEMPIDLDALDWSRPGSVHVRTMVVHSRGDDEIPFELSEAFAAAHPDVVTLVRSLPAPHGWEPNVDPEGFAAAIRTWQVRRN